MSMALNPYLAIAVAFLFCAGLSVLVSALSLMLGPKKPTPEKLDVYECGLPVRTPARTRMSVKFYLTAILFILFDIETIFLYLWASAFDSLGLFGVVEVGFFVVTLLVGYVYVVKRGALLWE